MGDVMRCDKCRFWVRYISTGTVIAKIGECRCCAPEPVASGFMRQGNYLLDQHCENGVNPPTTPENYWCGDFEAGESGTKTNGRLEKDRADIAIGDERKPEENVAMYERFTDRARKVMQLANQEAQRFNHEYIGTEHILLGLIKEGSGVAANVLKNLDVDLRKIRLEVEKLMESGPDMVIMGKLPQTPRAKKVIEYAMEEARNLNHNYVGDEHLLLCLMRDQEGVAGIVLLRKLGLTLEEVRAEVLRLLGAKEDNAEAKERQQVATGPAAWIVGLDGQADKVDLSRFTDLARKALRLAEKEAQRCNYSVVVTGNVLFGLTKGCGVAAAAMRGLGIVPERVCTEVVKRLTVCVGPVAMDSLPLSRNVQGALALAERQAEQWGHSYIGTEHVLLGLLREKGGMAGDILEELGVQPEAVRREVLRLLGMEEETETAEIELVDANITIHKLPQKELQVDRPLSATVRRLGHEEYIAEIQYYMALSGSGDTPHEAWCNLADIIGAQYLLYSETAAGELGPEPTRMLDILRQYISRVEEAADG